MAIALSTLAYARRLREGGFSEQQAEAQAEALAEVMTDSLATKQDLREMQVVIDARFAQVDARFAQVDARFERVDARFDSLERHFDTRLDELEKRTDLRFQAWAADIERRMTLRLGGITVAGIGFVSVLVKIL